MKYWVELSELGRAFTEMNLALRNETQTELKPFPTCQTCDKWKTIKCVMSKLLSDTLRNSRCDYSKLIYPNHDFFCPEHPDFTKEMSEVTNGKDM
jgi:hypothetical protein